MYFNNDSCAAVEWVVLTGPLPPTHFADGLPPSPVVSIAHVAQKCWKRRKRGFPIFHRFSKKWAATPLALVPHPLFDASDVHLELALSRGLGDLLGHGFACRR